MATVLRSHCAFARLFGGKRGQILYNVIDFGIKSTPESLSVISISKKYSNYAHSPFVTRVKERYNYEVVEKPPEWTYVKRLLPFETIPAISPKDNYPSGYIPPQEEARNLPYFIPRNKNHYLPIYLDITFRGMRKISIIKKIDGDIWLLNDEIKSYLKKKHNRYVETRVHEMGRFIEVKGDYVNALKDWAYSKGF
ncbi:probable 39S ribosomal protein L49, mitochondrial [Galleria mellonella]|uniref:Large ribosomal subunit protein mL49 n=1 Tax=Galleria mellonella TaxID=7137 RepID=A0A6J1WGI0_GALME|nr:probable 39S ribosomal protein L49, mitochondrial [Galleria mellonella]